ncbi:MAG: TIGR01777 family protein [Williamsia sp.]|nr:TIGR01777 family protein [Williamsia sp.]
MHATKYNKIVLAGGSGHLGQVLAKHFKPLADQVVILSRSARPQNGHVQTVVWDGQHAGDWVQHLEGAALLVNLCGKNVNCRYTEKNKREILASRITPTLLLGKTLQQMEQPPALWINITSATIYRHAEDRPQDENTGEIGYGFSIDVCRQWEEAFFQIPIPHTRKIALRLGIVLSRHDGVFPRLLNLVKCGLGGHQGEGTQYISWIHEQDVARSIEWLTDHSTQAGIFNCTAPQAMRNREFMLLLRHAYGMPVGLPAPAWLLEIGAALIGTETELILKSRWVSPQRLLDAGFPFHYSQAEYAVHDLLGIVEP